MCCCNAEENILASDWKCYFLFFYLLFGLFIAVLHNIFVSTTFVLVICLLTCQSRGFIFLAAKPLLITLTPSPSGEKVL